MFWKPYPPPLTYFEAELNIDAVVSPPTVCLRSSLFFFSFFGYALPGLFFGKEPRPMRGSALSFPLSEHRGVWM